MYLIRHGESENNIKRLFTGWQDVKLTEKGIDDAKKTRKYLDGIVFDKIYSSDLIRARQTAEAALPGCVYETTDLVREISVGILEGKSYDTEVKITNVKKEKDESTVADCSLYDGESGEEFKARLSKFLEMAEKSGFENIAVFTHGAAMRQMTMLTTGLILQQSKVICNNCAISILEYNGAQWQLHSWINV